jgi:hypothetical protein
MILILGKGTLGQDLKKVLPNSVIVGRPEYDLSKKDDCDRLIEQYTPTVLINTVGVLSNDIWNTLVTNYVSSVYVSINFYEKIKNLHIINVSSASSYWPSYPGIDSPRMCYNLSKESLTNFGKHMSRKTIDEPGFIISTVEPGSFSSQMNNFTPGKISSNDVVNIIKNIIDHRITHVAVIK